MMNEDNIKSDITELTHVEPSILNRIFLDRLRERLYADIEFY